MPQLLMFGLAREVSGLGADDFGSTTLEELLTEACRRYPPRFADVLAASRLWVNGDEPTSTSQRLDRTDEVAVIPPIAGG